ncbi:MAG: S41 family peptidase [Bacteroidaceae bacterium]|nr:S41 family peptidase [Bacteroidaceae bacterium]MBR3983667.1 S41 family peptidase [Bacteroidaceae bacterium]
MKKSRRCIVGFLLFSAVCLVLMSFKGDKRNSFIAKNLDLFHSVFRELEMMYVDTIDVDRTIESAIHGMLSNLDPYTVFYPEDEDEDLRMMMTGKYAGVGAVVRYHAKHDRVVVVEPYEGMPAFGAGLRAGDILLSIDGEDLKGWPVDKVSEKLRGESGTTLFVRAKREGVADSLLEVKITRANIALPSVPYYTMFADSVGYIILNSFTENCARDVRLSLVDLKNRGARKLILDLRGNGGGSLAEAVDIVGLFVPKGTQVVSTRGKLSQASQTFKTQREPLDLTIPLVVLVDGQSASASEIVAGAIQDLDRGVVMGWRTFGKGLVQSVRELPYNSSLKITTSKYYTPSGRCVQKIDYSKAVRSKGEEDKTESAPGEFYTLSGRPVKAAGGITPDVVLKELAVPNLLFYLANSDILFDFATDYAHSHPTIAPVDDFVVNDSLYAAFKEAVKASDFKYDRQSEKALAALKEVAAFEGYLDEASETFALLEKQLSHDIDRDFEYFDQRIRELLADELVSRYYYQRGAIIQAIKSDSTVFCARDLLADSVAYRAMLVPAAK